MAMTLAIPSSPADGAPPSSVDSSNGSLTPVSPTSVQTLALAPPVDGEAAPQAAPSVISAQSKRKPSRRANTAERRATHNAVERQRRETLNSRFLDLAALLPNLSQIRRPSKSSIVNSSIAHIHASRRHRMHASRELRLVKMEADALRRELNEWRDRSGLPRVEEPIRGEAFQMVLNGEVEVLNPGPIEEEDGDYPGDDYGDEDYPALSNAGVMAGAPHSAHMNVAVGSEDPAEELRNPLARAAAASLLNTADANPFAHSAPAIPAHLHTILPRPAQGPIIVQSPTGMSFENPVMPSMYEPHPHPSQMHAQFPHFMGPAHHATESEKMSSWSNHMYNALANSGAASLGFSPPTSALNNGGHMGTPQQQQQHAAFLNFQRQQAMMQHRGMNTGHIYGSPVDGDDSSSVGSPPGSANVRRERSGSNGGRMGGFGGFEIPNLTGGAMQRRMSNTAVGTWDDSMGMGGLNMMMKGSPITAGGGGNGFAMMML